MGRNSSRQSQTDRFQKFIWIFIALLCTAFLALVLLTERSNKKQENEIKEKVQEVEQVEDDMKMSVSDEALNTTEDDCFYDLISVQNGKCDADILLSAEEFNKNVKYTIDSDLGMFKLKCDIDAVVEETDNLILQFEAYTDEGSISLDVSYGDVTHTVYVTEMPRAIYIVITGVTEIDSISIKNDSDYVSTHVTNVNLLNYGSQVSVEELKTGYYDLSEYSSEMLDSEDSVIEESTSLLCDDDLLYSINYKSGDLQIYQIDGEVVILLGELSGLGTARDMHLTEDKSALLVTSRRNGMFIVSVSDPSNPYIISTYDALEYCTGLEVRGGYAFVCSRWFGIEIVDISDLSNPTYVTTVQGENEYQDCYVDENGYLYVGVYNGKRVDIWDVSDLGNTSMVASVNTDGASQGLYVQDGYLYISTALNNSETTKSLVSTSEFSCGTGNGLEIYDVHDPANPIWCSTTKLNGRMNVNLHDIWDVTVSSDGKFAYVSSMYNGLYVYDVSNVSSPTLYKKIDMSASSDSEDYESFDTSKYVFPYDASSVTRGCVTKVNFSEGHIWISTYNMGVFCIDTEEMTAAVESYDSEIIVTDIEQSIPTILGYTVTQYATNSQIYAVQQYGEYLAVACGSEGLQILTEDLELVTYADTDGSVKDVQVFGDYIFTAEGNAGLGIYTFDGTTLQRISGFTDTEIYNSCFGSIQVSADGKYILAETTQSGFCVLDVSDIYNPYKVVTEGDYSPGLIYYRTVCNGLVDDQYFSIAGGTNYVVFSSGESGLTVEAYESNDIYERSDGATAYGDKCIITGDNGYYYYDYSTGELSDRVKIVGITFEGKISAYNNLLVISTEGTGHVMFVDITDLDNPSVLREFDVDGNPDVALITDEYILLPCRNGGLLKIVSN